MELCINNTQYIIMIMINKEVNPIYQFVDIKSPVDQWSCYKLLYFKLSVKQQGTAYIYMKNGTGMYLLKYL